MSYTGWKRCRALDCRNPVRITQHTCDHCRKRFIDGARLQGPSRTRLVPD